MTISNLLERLLLNAFYTSNIIRYQNLSGQSIVIRLEDTNIVPSICTQYLEDYRGTLVVPINVHHRDIKKTSDSVINSLFNRVYARGFSYIDTTKGYGYYGSNGIILDDRYHPLLICGYETEITSDSYNYIQPVCLVSPEVFGREDMISKCIVKKIIPYYSKAEVYSGARTSNGRVKIIISSEINRFIHNVVPPMGTDVDDDMYNILENELNYSTRDLL